jgi:hypothetical protein
MRNPGAALTSTIAPPASRTGSARSGAMKSIPATSRPTTRAASSAISTLSGMGLVGAVDRDPAGRHVAGQGQLDHGPSGGTSSSSNPWERTSSTAASSTRMRVRTFSCPTPRRGVGVGQLDQLGNGVGAVADHVGRDPLGDRHHLPATTSTR